VLAPAEAAVEASIPPALRHSAINKAFLIAFIPVTPLNGVLLTTPIGVSKTLTMLLVKQKLHRSVQS
jgi:hypothetical protein